MLMLLSAGMTESGTSVRGSISSRLTFSPRKSPEPTPGKVLMLPVMEELLCEGALQRVQDKRSDRPRPDPRSVRKQRWPGVRPSGSVHNGVAINIFAAGACFAGRNSQSVVPTAQRSANNPGSLACSRFCTSGRPGGHASGGYPFISTPAHPGGPAEFSSSSGSPDPGRVNDRSTVTRQTSTSSGAAAASGAAHSRLETVGI